MGAPYLRAGVTRRALLPLAVGVVAVIIGGWLVWRAWFDAPQPGPSASAATPHVLRTTPLVDRAGGFRIRVPHGLHGRLDGHSALVANKHRSLVLVVAPSGHRPVRAANRAVVAGMRAGYHRLRIIGHRHQRVHGHRGLSTFGTATNHAGVRIRWVQLTVKAGPRTFTIATYTRHDSDPHWVLPRVNAVVNSFRVLKR